MHRFSIGLLSISWFLSATLISLLAGGQSLFLLGFGACCLFMAGLVGLVLGSHCGTWSVKQMPISLLVGLAVVAYVFSRSLPAWVLIDARLDLVLALIGMSLFLLTRVVVELLDGKATLILGVLTVFVIANIAVGVYQSLGAADEFFPIPGYRRVGYVAGRAGGFFNNPNQYASFLGVAGLLFLARGLLVRRMAPGQFAWIGLFGLCLLGLVLSGSRSVLVLFTVATVFTLILVGAVSYRLQGTMPRWLKIGSAVLVGLGAVVLLLGLQRLGETRAEGVIGGMEERRLMRAICYRQVQEEPLIGTGAGTYREFSRLNRSVHWPPYLQDSDPEKAHSDWAQLGGEYGVVGLALGGGCLLWLLVAAFKVLRSARAGNEDMEKLRWWVAVLSATALLGSHSIIDFPLRSPAVLALFAIIVGVAVAVRKSPFLLGPNRPHGLVFIALIGLNSWVWWMGPGLMASEKSRWNENQPSVAIEHLSSAISHDSQNSSYHHRLGDLWVALGERFDKSTVRNSFFAKAETAFRNAWSLRPQDYTALESLVVILDRQGKYDEAAPLHIQAQALAPRHRRCWVNYCLHLDAVARKSQDPTAVERALEQMEEVLQRFGNGDRRLVRVLADLQRDNAAMKRRLEAEDR